jgi:hypothetical protein
LDNYSFNDMGIQRPPIDVHACIREDQDALIEVLGLTFALGT